MTQQPAQQPSPDPLGSLVKHTREHDLQLSQADLAWLAGVSRGTISNVETGRVTPDTRTWHRIRTALALPPIPLDEARAGFAAQTMLPADAVQGIISAIVVLRDRDPEAGGRATDRWRRLVVQLTRGNTPAWSVIGAELTWLADDIAPLVPPGRRPVVYEALRGWGWAPASAHLGAEIVPKAKTRGPQLAQGFDSVPEQAREVLTSGLIITCDVTIPQMSPDISIINFIVMRATGSSLLAQHEAHEAALRWDTILAVATHIVEQQAPDLSPKEIIRALKSGLDAQSPAEVRHLLPQANGGDPQAMYRLARLLRENGRPDESERWLRRAAEHGHPGALFTLGNLVAEEGGHSEAVHWLRGAADAGHTDAMYNLSILLREDAPRDARSWLRKAADGGNRNAMYRLWMLLRENDDREAERWLRRAANNGHRQALTDLSTLVTERGSEDEAVRWLHRAAQEGDSDAMSRYEVMLYERQLRQRAASRNVG
jgi:TPR repeat protein/DNA-binding XRE family transcriptional regulator